MQASDAIAIVPCDNMPGNGELARRGVTALAGELSVELASWLATHVSFVSTSVDRITPRMTEDDLERVARDTGWDDRAAVVAEPFSNWILCGDFPAGRPDWHKAGARFVSDIEPFERRKLWLLNGAHTLLAALGQLRGHGTVAEAIADPVCSDAVHALWDEAAHHLPAVELDIETYRADLLERFRNARIEHRLSQIAEDSEVKLRVRIAPVARRERDAGRDADACALAIAAWLVLRAGQTDTVAQSGIDAAGLRSTQPIDPGPALEMQAGDDVVHASFGDGVVTAVEPGGVVVVRFAGDGSERKLMADYAPIRKAASGGGAD